MELFRVDESGVEGGGKGLFAAQDIACDGSKILEYTGRVLTLKEARALTDRTYLMGISWNHHIDGNVEEASIAKYINDHVDKTKINVKCKKINKRAFIVPLREIKAGEELFMDYGRGYWLFVGAKDFLGLEIDRERGVVVAAKDLDDHEVVCCYHSPALLDIDHLCDYLQFAQVQEDTNTRLKPSPFVNDTIVVTATRPIKQGETLVINWLDRIEVKQSMLPNAGLGAFARVPIRGNTIIGFYEGKIVSRETALATKSAAVAKYLFRLNSDLVIDPTDLKGQVRPYRDSPVIFINHNVSENANCKFNVIVDQDNHFVVQCVATTDIAKGEELDVDYFDYLPRE